MDQLGKLIDQRHLLIDWIIMKIACTIHKKKIFADPNQVHFGCAFEDHFIKCTQDHFNLNGVTGTMSVEGVHHYVEQWSHFAQWTEGLK